MKSNEEGNWQRLIAFLRFVCIWIGLFASIRRYIFPKEGFKLKSCMKDRGFSRYTQIKQNMIIFTFVVSKIAKRMQI